MFNRKVLAAAALGIVALTAAPAAAQTSITVPTADLQLSTEAGQRTLDARLKVAVRDICGTQPAVRGVRETRDYRQCVTNSTASFDGARRIAIAEAREDSPRMAVAEERPSNSAG